MTSSEKKQGKSSPYTSKMGHLKGHVSVKSNAFSTTCKRLSSQDMVLDNMMAHTRKINSVKSRIDTSIPKTWTSSVVKKDQLRRKAMQNGNTPSRPSSAPVRAHHPGYPTTAPKYPAKFDQYLDGDLSLEDFDILSDISGDDIHYQTACSSPAYPRYRSTNNIKHISNEGRNSPQMLLRYRGNQSHDLLDTMSTRFTEGGKSHTPRTLKTTAKSRLAQSKYYNTPKRKERQTTSRRSADKDEKTNPKMEKERDGRHSRLERDYVKQDESESVDKRNEDHIRWVEEQAERVHHLHLDEEPENKDLNRDTKDLPIYSARLETMSYRSRSQNEKRMREEEEELLYLEFVTDVTNDVLNRGIYTNTVLKQVFDAHINRNKDKLDEGRMKMLMQQLQQDLAIPETD